MHLIFYLVLQIFIIFWYGYSLIFCFLHQTEDYGARHFSINLSNCKYLPCQMYNAYHFVQNKEKNIHTCTHILFSLSYIKYVNFHLKGINSCSHACSQLLCLFKTLNIYTIYAANLISTMNVLYIQKTKNLHVMTCINTCIIRL